MNAKAKRKGMAGGYAWIGLLCASIIGVTVSLVADQGSLWVFRDLFALVFLFGWLAAAVVSIAKELLTVNVTAQVSINGIDDDGPTSAEALRRRATIKGVTP